MNILDTPVEERFDRHIRLIADIFNVPTVALSLVDLDRQWFKSSVGCRLRQTPREESICTHALNLSYLEIPDLLEDPFFRDHPAARANPPIRFYAAAVIYGPTGKPIGTLCLTDGAPRKLSLAEQGRLKAFARIIQHEITRDTALENDRRSLQDSARRDPKTGLPGETLLEETLANLIRKGETEQSQLAIMQLHVENLATATGLHHRKDYQNAMMQALVDRLVGLYEGILAAGRTGSDRLVLVVPTVSKDSMLEAAKRILDKLTEPVEFKGRRLRPDINIGISVYPEDGTKAHLLMDLSEQAFALSKGHHKIHFYDAVANESAARRHLIQHRLELALVDNQITLNFQPIWLANGTQIIKFEALARWQDEELGVISPGEFVPIAEKNPWLSRLLTDNVLRMACREARTWQKKPGYEPPRVAVNIPAGEFHQPEFADRVLELLSEGGLEPCRLTLELTEEGLIQDIDQAIRTMTQLSDKGITLALDDFGTGYSSLNHFRRLPMDILKIDKSFIDSLPGDKKGLELVSGIIKIAHAMGLAVVAEGVEHEAQRALLAELDCDMIQGYLLGRPIAAEKIPEILN